MPVQKPNILYLSIGENCLADIILKRHELKAFSTPYSHARSNIDYVIKLEKSAYSGLLAPGNLFYPTESYLPQGAVRSNKIIECDDIIGDGPHRKELEKLTKKLGVENIINFYGESAEPEKYISKANIAVFPSRYGEGLQGTVLESMASGICVLASDTLINRELLMDDRGLIINQNNIDDITEKIMLCLHNRNIMAKYGTNAHDFIIKNYDWKVMTKKFLEEIV
ncbi:MAG: DUF1796 family putative cysteine peptidase [Bacteroidales bacterium]|jgi:hypothetical protein|nr:DUF1796 family putative cysteine peptidase [Bacteroidales bacterium]